MKLTLSHQTSQEETIKKIDGYLNELMKQEFSGVTIIDPEKKWDENIMRFSFGAEKFFFTLDFSGTVIVTNQEVIGEAEIPLILFTFISEERIKKVITKKFNEIFKIQ